MAPWSAEVVAAIILGIVSFLNEVLTVIPFWWRLFVVVSFMLVVGDLCLRSAFTRQHFRQPFWRIMLSTGALVLIGLLLWTPMRKQHMQEHLPPSFAYLAGGWTNAPHYGTSGMTMVIDWRHYGPNPASNIDLNFTDVDRRLATNRWLGQHPGGQDAISQQLLAQDHRDFHKDEVDKSGAGFDAFPWVPLNLDHQHYQANIRCRDGVFEEQLWFVSNGMGGSSEAMRLSQFTPDTSTGQEKILFECADPEVAKTIKGFADVLSSCNVVLTSHLGEPRLPLSLPDKTSDAQMLIIVVIYAGLVILPLYWIFAAWWIWWWTGDADLFLVPHDGGEQH